MKTNKIKKYEELKINKKLPQIHISQKQVDLFINWWNQDIRFQKTVPQSFEEGYLKCDLNFNIDVNKFNNLFKQMAKTYHTTYRKIETMFKDFINSLEHIIMYFKFIKDNEIIINTYDINNKILSNISFGFGENSKEIEEEFSYEKLTSLILTSESLNNDNLMNGFNILYMIILITSLWYIATTKNTTKYIYEHKTPIITNRKKNIVKVSDTKIISTPIYDITKIKTKKVDGLIKHRKGWTYSHAFQVHGHYRHYKDGKVIFVNSYIKGKNKEFKSQTIDLKPTQ